MQVEGQHGTGLPVLVATGEWVSNEYPTWPILGYSPAKAGLMPDAAVYPHGLTVKGVIWYGMGMHPISWTAG